MKDKSKQAKFFCESCGSEVNANARFCNNCGKFFSSVRCPNCGRTGTTSEFESGCPDCGYAVGKHGYSGFYGNNKSNGKKHNIFNLLFSKDSSGGYESSNNNNNDSLPFWVYILAIAVLVIVVVCVYSCL